MLNELSKEIHETALEHGWWDEDRGFGEVIALCHSELSEALEEDRAHKPMAYHQCARKDEECERGCTNCEGCKHWKPEGVAVEMADCIIRILDWCGKNNVNIDSVVAEKMFYNKTRPYKHGGKKY